LRHRNNPIAVQDNKPSETIIFKIKTVGYRSSVDLSGSASKTSAVPEEVFGVAIIAQSAAVCSVLNSANTRAGNGDGGGQVAATLSHLAIAPSHHGD